MSRTTTHNIEITCPEWCVEDPAHPAAELWNAGGCIHTMSADVADTHGYYEALAEPRFHEPIRIDLQTFTSPENRENATATTRVNGSETSIQQAEDVAKKIQAMVRCYRENGGVE